MKREPPGRIFKRGPKVGRWGWFVDDSLLYDAIHNLF